MNEEIKEKVQYWLDLAQYDLDTAYIMLEGQRYLYVGFMCHQVVEKVLKAATWSIKGEAPEYTHSLTRLLRKSGLEGEQFQENFYRLMDFLEPMNIEARYPTQKEKLLSSLTQERSEHIIMETKEFFEWIKMKL